MPAYDHSLLRLLLSPVYSTDTPAPSKDTAIARTTLARSHRLPRTRWLRSGERKRAPCSSPTA